MFFEILLPQEVNEVIKSLKKNNSLDSYYQSNNLIKKISPVISELLSCLFNQCVELTYPLDFKIAEVQSIHKTGTLSDCDNYRTTSILPIMGRFSKN